MQTSQNLIKVTICGGGNGSHASVATIGQKERVFSVNILTRSPEKWKNQIVADTKGSSFEYKGDIVGKLAGKSSDAAPFADTDIWIISGPAHIHPILLKKILPYVKKGAYVGTLFAQGGFDWMFNEIFGGPENQNKREITLFGLFNIPWICKIKQYGESVRIIGPKDKLYLAVRTQTEQKRMFIAAAIEKMFDMNVEFIPNFLTLTLTPSNQIIHPARVYGVFKDWDGKTPREKIPLFYEDMDDFSAEMLENLDGEIQAIKSAILKRFPHFDLSYVIPLKDRIIKQYGNQVADRTNMKTVFRTNQGYRTVQIPTKQVQGGFLLNTEARIFWEDVPYGLCILHDLGRLIGVQTPWTNLMIEWHQKFMGKTFIKNGQILKEIIPETGAPARYGINSIEQLIANDSNVPKPGL